MMHTVPHLVKMSRFPFKERVLAIDTAPLTGDKVGRPDIGTMAQLRSCCDRLLQAGIVDRIVDFDYSPNFHRQTYRKHFGVRVRQTHNWKGYPILGSQFQIESGDSNYMLHYDSDMMLYQHPDFSWIATGMQMMDSNPDLLTIRPLTGPPTADGRLYQSGYERDPAGFYRFKTFSSRVYLIQRERFDRFLPLPVMWRSYRHRWLDHLPDRWKTRLNYLTGKGSLESWEVMVTQKLQTTDSVRAVLTSPQAWTLHPNLRSPEFFQALPSILKAVESGEFPPEQAGHYDLKLDCWLRSSVLS